MFGCIRLLLTDPRCNTRVIRLIENTGITPIVGAAYTGDQKVVALILALVDVGELDLSSLPIPMSETKPTGRSLCDKMSQQKTDLRQRDYNLVYPLLTRYQLHPELVKLRLMSESRLP